MTDRSNRILAIAAVVLLAAIAGLLLIRPRIPAPAVTPPSAPTPEQDKPEPEPPSPVQPPIPPRQTARPEIPPPPPKPERYRVIGFVVDDTIKRMAIGRVDHESCERMMYDHWWFARVMVNDPDAIQTEEEYCRLARDVASELYVIHLLPEKLVVHFWRPEGPDFRLLGVFCLTPGQTFSDASFSYSNTLYKRAEVDWARPRTAILMRWIDGDTAVVWDGGIPFRVRIPGWDAPEITRTAHARRQAEAWGADVETVVSAGKWSKELAENIIPPDTLVHLMMWPEGTDKYGRLLASLVPVSGRTPDHRPEDGDNE